MSDSLWNSLTGDSSSAIAALILFIMPVFGFIIGSVINFFGSWGEYVLYKGITRRPSSLLLNNKYERTPISDLDSLKQKLGCGSGIIENEKAKSYLLKAKGKIEDTEKIDMLHTKSIYSRNLLTAQVLLIIVCVVIEGLLFFINAKGSDTILKNVNIRGLIMIGLMILIIFPYWNAWRRNCIIYVRACFQKYLHDPSN